MKKQNSFKMYLLTLFFLTFTSKVMFCQVEQLSTSEDINMPGSGPHHSATFASTLRDLVKISYSDDFVGNNGSSYSKNILLTAPRRFDRDGVYIWRDADRVWNLRTFGNTPFSISGEIAGVESFDQKGTIGNGFQIISDKPNVIKILGSAGLENSGMQFRTESSEVTFDLLINGQHQPERIYLGDKLRNPEFTPFIIENKPLSDLNFQNEKKISKQLFYDNTNSRQVTKSLNEGSGGKKRR